MKEDQQNFQTALKVINTKIQIFVRLQYLLINHHLLITFIGKYIRYFPQERIQIGSPLKSIDYVSFLFQTGKEQLSSSL